jgi:hypothetical protein
MKRMATLIFLAITGLISGVVAGAFNTGLVPHCGDPCAVERLGSSATWGLALLVAFPIIGGFALRKIGGGPARAAAVAAFLSFTTLLPAAAIYGYELHQQYWKGPARLGVPDVDFSKMAIATRPVMATAGDSKVRIKAWERCALGISYCDKKPRTVEALCLDSGTTLLIDEKDWPAFRRIPAEDLQGIENAPRDMKLCAAWDQ